MKLKKYDDFLKENLNEEMPEEIGGEMPEEIGGEMGESEEEISPEIESEEMGEESEFEQTQGEEEEESEWQGTKLMNELAERLGSEVVNNSINFEGKTINFFSETESFHVGNKKFKTVDEVVDFLTK